MLAALKACALAGEFAMIDYNKGFVFVFCKRASHSKISRWDLNNDKIWFITYTI